MLSGYHAPSLDGSGWNQWQVDDATGQLRMRLATSYQASQLDLGYLLKQAPTGSQRGAATSMKAAPTPAPKRLARRSATFSCGV